MPTSTHESWPALMAASLIGLTLFLIIPHELLTYHRWRNAVRPPLSTPTNHLEAERTLNHFRSTLNRDVPHGSALTVEQSRRLLLHVLRLERILREAIRRGEALEEKIEKLESTIQRAVEVEPEQAEGEDAADDGEIGDEAQVHEPGRETEHLGTGASAYETPYPAESAQRDTGAYEFENEARDQGRVSYPVYEQIWLARNAHGAGSKYGARQRWNSAGVVSPEALGTAAQAANSPAVLDTQFPRPHRRRERAMRRSETARNAGQAPDAQNRAQGEDSGWGQWPEIRREDAENVFAEFLAEDQAATYRF